MKIVVFENYFTFSDNIYKPPKGTATGSLIWSIIVEIFLHYFEDSFIKYLLETRSIIFCTRYVDDILVVYDQSTIDPNFFTSNVSRIHKHISFQLTSETNKQLIFLDLLLLRNDSATEFDIYRYPITADTTLNFLSNHPVEHNTTEYRHLLNRFHSLSLSLVCKHKV